jgi:hypothetical protein
VERDVDVAPVNFMLPSHSGRRLVFGKHHQLVDVRQNSLGIGIDCAPSGGEFFRVS